MEKIEQKSIEIDPTLLKGYQENKYTIVHCRHKSNGGPLRIWKSTRLEDTRYAKAGLLFAIGISLFPNWNFIEKADGYSYFTLIFESLSTKKVPFILIEDIPEPGGFYSATLDRNETEVYYTDLQCL